MKRVLLAAAFALIVAGVARADCPTVTSSTADSACIRDVMVHGNRGTWFDLENANEILRVRRLYPELELQVSKLGMVNALAERENKELHSAVALLQDTQKNLQAQLALANKDAREAREAAKGHWYSSPVFWGITMFIAGAAIQNVCCSGR